MKLAFMFITEMALVASARSQDFHQALIPLDGRWIYPHYLTFRPGDGQVSDVNPPRFSWGYVPNILMDLKKGVALDEFCFQLSKTPDFSSPEIEVKTPYNFYNALPSSDVVARGPG